jgi:O-antigen ligase
MPARSTLLLAAAPLAAAAIGVFADGGYDAAPRVAFGLAALGAAAVVLAVTRERAVPAVAIVLLALAALGALSAIWTIGPVDRTLRWALVTAGYAALVVAAAAVARRPRGVETLAAGIALIAAVSAAIGLVAALTHTFPQALRIAGAWRPAGTFEYPPALAALQVAALPAFISGLRHPRVRAAAAVGLLMAAAVLVLAASRIALALALVVAGLALSRRVARLRPAAAVTAILVAAIAGSVAFGAAPNRGVGPAAGFLHGRTDTWSAALETYADHPVLGTGADAFLAGSARYQDGQTIRFAHDLPLELMVELGIAGLLLALALYGTGALTLWQARRSVRTLWLLGPAAAVFLVTSLVDWQWHLAGAGAVWALAIGGLAGAALAAEKSPGPA